ncbi:MAG: GGDEF domain-containing protein, partial [Ruminococcaceae bacterium]|nr:GGDEF domain-containing protein [Oscillospiraceae bacterium]
AQGNPREFQTTKLKFTDNATGRLCTLAMRLDYTEVTLARKEAEEVQAAYDKLLSANVLYAHMAHAFSENYSQIYYVDVITDWYATYSSGADMNDVTGELQGRDFFNASRENALSMICKDDHDEFFKAFTKENILKTVDEQGEFTLSYRLQMDDAPLYCSLRATRAPGDSRHLIVDVSGGGAENSRNELTGLYKEAAFYNRGKELLRGHPEEEWRVYAIDLENFKLFNEWYGRETGDRLLARIGELLSVVETNTGGIAGYMGQDDFALIAPYDEERVRELFNEIHGFVIERGTSMGFMPAIGMCVTDGSSDVEELYDRAAQAARHAKEDYHRRIRVFEEAMYKKTEQDYQILSDFQQALKKHELYIQLQPQCELDGGKIVGAESLVRWKKTDGSMVSPGIFVPVLEQYGFVSDLDQFVWEDVCAWQRRWIDAGHTPLPVSVNVSQIDILTIDVPAFFDMLVKKYDLPPEIIKIEITESAYVADGAVADTVKRLRERGFIVLMDDFGSGYSSLNMLRSLNVDVIKLDAKFLRMNNDDRKGVQILESIVGMAKSMEAPIIVEGVETEEETEFIKELGCHYVQGYHFYRPMPVPDFEKLIGDEENIDTGGFVLG